jgi:hypothetical protein
MAIVLGIMILSLTFSGKKEYPLSTWLWDAKHIRDSPNEVLTFLKKQQVQHLYLQVDPEIGRDTYSSFIQKANQAGIDVHALGGAPSWVKAQHRESYQEWQRWIEDYQASCTMSSQMFVGIHLDVEPYLLQGWTPGEPGWIEGYQRLIKEGAAFSEQNGLSFGVDIPFWWDEISFANQYGIDYLARWVMQHTDSVTIMAYRNTAQGPNGILELTAFELTWAKELGKSVSIAVETLPQEEEHTTFSSSTLPEMQKQLHLFLENSNHKSAFSGFAIHDLSGWMRLAAK